MFQKVKNKHKYDANQLSEIKRTSRKQAYIRGNLSRCLILQSCRRNQVVVWMLILMTYLVYSFTILDSGYLERIANILQSTISQKFLTSLIMSINKMHFKNHIFFNLVNIVTMMIQFLYQGTYRLQPPSSAVSALFNTNLQRCAGSV